MAQSERFYFWRGYYDAMDYLTDDEVGRLFRAICAYAFDGEEPDFEGERVLQVAWTMVADTARESVEMGKRASEGGRKSGEARRDKAPTKGASKGVPKGVRKSPSKGVPKGASNVGYGSTPSAGADGGGASPAAPAGAALAPAEAWYRDNDVDVPPVPQPPETGA